MKSKRTVYVTYEKRSYLDSNYNSQYYFSPTGVYFDEEQAARQAKRDLCGYSAAPLHCLPNNGDGMKLKIELSQENILAAIKFWLEAKGHSVTTEEICIYNADMQQQFNLVAEIESENKT